MCNFKADIKVYSRHKCSVLFQSYLWEAENVNLSSTALTAETQLTDHLPAIHFASGNKMLEESQGCFKGSLVA